MTVITADFELPGHRRGRASATLSPEGVPTGVHLLNADASLSEEERVEVVRQVEDLLSQVGMDLLRQIEEAQGLRAAKENVSVTPIDPIENLEDMEIYEDGE